MQAALAFLLPVLEEKVSFNVVLVNEAAFFSFSFFLVIIPT